MDSPLERGGIEHTPRKNPAHLACEPGQGYSVLSNLRPHPQKGMRQVAPVANSACEKGQGETERKQKARLSGEPGKAILIIGEFCYRKSLHPSEKICPFWAYNSVVPKRGKIDIEKIRASLNTPCPECGHNITPAERQYLSSGKIICPQCKLIFSPAPNTILRPQSG